MSNKTDTYLNHYLDSHRKFHAIDNFTMTIVEAGKTNPSLKKYLNDSHNLMMGSLLQSSRILYTAINDYDDFIKAGIKEETVSFIKLHVRIAYTHLAYYLGAKVLDKFVSDITETPLDEFFVEREYEYYN